LKNRFLFQTTGIVPLELTGIVLKTGSTPKSHCNVLKNQFLFLTTGIY
jgi:hypothetical protein